LVADEETGLKGVASLKGGRIRVFREAVREEGRVEIASYQPADLHR
jgi:hypothetical protein